MTARSSFPCPAIRTGGMRATKSMADGNTYTDRNDYDASLRLNGLRIEERGDPWSKPEKPLKDIGEVLNRALQRQGHL